MDSSISYGFASIRDMLKSIKGPLNFSKYIIEIISFIFC